MKLLKKEQGFTLIELLVIVSIIGVLATITLSSLNQARLKARDTIRIKNIRSIQTVLEIYYLDNGEYPNSGGATSTNSWVSSDDPEWLDLANELKVSLPVDPINEIGHFSSGSFLNYSYYSGSWEGMGCPQGQWYFLTYRLESKDTPFDDIPGVKRCPDGSIFKYPNGIITVGSSSASPAF